MGPKRSSTKRTSNTSSAAAESDPEPVAGSGSPTNAASEDEEDLVAQILNPGDNIEEEQLVTPAAPPPTDTPMEDDDAQASAEESTVHNTDHVDVTTTTPNISNDLSNLTIDQSLPSQDLGNSGEGLENGIASTSTGDNDSIPRARRDELTSTVADCQAALGTLPPSLLRARTRLRSALTELSQKLSSATTNDDAESIDCLLKAFMDDFEQVTNSSPAQASTSGVSASSLSTKSNTSSHESTGVDIDSPVTEITFQLLAGRPIDSNVPEYGQQLFPLAITPEMVRKDHTLRSHVREFLIAASQSSRQDELEAFTALLDAAYSKNMKNANLLMLHVPRDGTSMFATTQASVSDAALSKFRYSTPTGPGASQSNASGAGLQPVLTDLTEAGDRTNEQLNTHYGNLLQNPPSCRSHVPPGGTVTPTTGHNGTLTLSYTLDKKLENSLWFRQWLQRRLYVIVHTFLSSEDFLGKLDPVLQAKLVDYTRLDDAAINSQSIDATDKLFSPFVPGSSPSVHELIYGELFPNLHLGDVLITWLRSTVRMTHNPLIMDKLLSGLASLDVFGPGDTMTNMQSRSADLGRRLAKETLGSGFYYSDLGFAVTDEGQPLIFSEECRARHIVFHLVTTIGIGPGKNFFEKKLLDMNVPAKLSSMTDEARAAELWGTSILKELTLSMGNTEITNRFFHETTLKQKQALLTPADTAFGALGAGGGGGRASRGNDSSNRRGGQSSSSSTNKSSNASDQDTYASAVSKVLKNADTLRNLKPAKFIDEVLKLLLPCSNKDIFHCETDGRVRLPLKLRASGYWSTTHTIGGDAMRKRYPSLAATMTVIRYLFDYGTSFIPGIYRQVHTDLSPADSATLDVLAQILRGDDNVQEVREHSASYSQQLKDAKQNNTKRAKTDRGSGRSRYN